MKSLIILSLFVLGINACINNPKGPISKINNEPVQTQRNDGLQNAYFASGCFWCTEAIFESIKGVKEVVSGYSGGITENPTYKQVGSGNSGHSETIEIQYDPNIIDFKTLVKAYYGSQDPTTYGQAPDFGSAYRSIIFFQNETERLIAFEARKEVQQSISKKVRTEIIPFEKFYKAEAYHQDYEKRNPNYPYIVRVSIPRLNKFKAKFPELIKDNE